jgi:myo-inositol-1(or 4)-monophosphatase
VRDRVLLEVLGEAADAVAGALARTGDWGPTGEVAGQHHSDLAADAAGVPVLVGAGLGVLSEESGLHHPERQVLVAFDPLDGSTNAAQGIPWYGVSMCALDGEGPRAALVANLVDGSRFWALRGQGAHRDGRPLRPSGARELSGAVVGASGYPPRHLGWRQYRVLGAAALDLCAVADGVLDGFLDCSPSGLGPWDYLGGVLVCWEAGAAVAELDGRDLVARHPGARRRPVAGATTALVEELVGSARA